MIKKIVILFIFLIKLPTAIAGNVNELEANNILDVNKGKVENVFLVKTMGSYFPIPTRYSYVPNLSGTTSKFVSGPKIGFIMKGLSQKGIPGGTIFIGPVEECEFCRNKLEASLLKRTKIQKIEKYKSLNFIRVF